MEPNLKRLLFRYAAQAPRRGLVRPALLLALALLAACALHPGPNVETASGRRLVSFTFTGQAKSVCLSGDFNGWSPDAHCLKKKGGRWEVRVALPPGRYRYGFLLDGELWATDPEALLHEEDGFGQKNSILILD